MLIDQAFGLSVAIVPFQTGTFAQRAARPLKGGRCWLKPQTRAVALVLRKG
ncbi:hypothetical protein [Aminobacter aminovorans]|uniref:hypothetical protein n=1 Tax=Aminobacter aminovorans TaxID=83263 RepID=UPI0012ED9D5E|nr:hypothetical protein [Aminobacter aminovorans]